MTAHLYVYKSFSFLTSLFLFSSATQPHLVHFIFLFALTSYTTFMCINWPWPGLMPKTTCCSCQSGLKWLTSRYTGRQAMTALVLCSYSSDKKNPKNCPIPQRHQLTSKSYCWIFNHSKSFSSNLSKLTQGMKCCQCHTSFLCENDNKRCRNVWVFAGV